MALLFDATNVQFRRDSSASKNSDAKGQKLKLQSTCIER